MPSDLQIESNLRCIEWRGWKDRDGYGRFHRLRDGERRPHRWAWIKFFGTIPDGLSVLYRCDNPACFNPTHFFLGTQRDNMRDKAIKQRGSNQYAKLTACARCGGPYSQTRRQRICRPCGRKYRRELDARRRAERS